jgi:hypothetical protein
VDEFLHVGDTDIADMLDLLGGVPFSCFGLVAADGTVGGFVPDFVLPVVEQHFESGLAFFRWAATVELPIVIELNLNRHLDSGFKFLHFS